MRSLNFSFKGGWPVCSMALITTFWKERLFPLRRSLVLNDFPDSHRSHNSVVSNLNRADRRSEKVRIYVSSCCLSAQGHNSEYMFIPFPGGKYGLSEWLKAGRARSRLTIPIFLML
jgi:hypothetical protein